jgi:hypothetical protein
MMDAIPHDKATYLNLNVISITGYRLNSLNVPQNRSAVVA